jgi:lysophospholipase L1-like esterase
MIKTLSVSLYYLALISISFGVTSSCNKQNNVVNNTPMPLSNALNYLALGDSYTIGEGVQANERFPYYTASLLKKRGIPINDPEYIATTGWTTSNLISAIDNKGVTGPFDIVTLLIGVNDQYQHLDTAGYRLRFSQLLNKAIQLSGNRRERVFVLSIPDYSATPFVGSADKQQISKEIDDFNFINKQVTQQHAVAYIDITPLSRQVINDPTLLANDGLHYSGKEHLKWAELLDIYIKKVIP